MILVKLFHGSIYDFEQFEISEKHLRTKKDSLMEGLGIYFSTEKDFAKDYGNYVYTIELDEKNCWDFTDKKVIKNIIKKLSQKVRLDLSAFIPQISIDSLISGQISATKFSREIILWLDSTESFYSIFEDDTEELFENIEAFYEDILNEKDFIKYYDSSFKANIYLCRNNAEKIIFTKETF